MESALDYQTAKALLEWQIELGVIDAIGDAPVDRYALPDAAPWSAKAKKAAAEVKPGLAEEVTVDPVAVAREAAGRPERLRNCAQHWPCSSIAS